MAKYKIRMKKKNKSNDWDTLFPQTVMENVLENENSQVNLKTIIDDIKANGVPGDSGTIGSLKYTSQDPATTTVGGISAGYIPPSEGIELVDLFYIMLHPYSRPSINISTTPPFGVYEIGATLSITAIKANVTKKTNPISLVELYREQTLINSFSNNISDGGLFTFTPVVPIQVSSNATFVLNVGDGNSITSTSGSFSFVYAMYYGVSATVPKNIDGLSKMIKSKSNQTLSFTTSYGHAVFAYPQSYGNLTTIMDQNNFNCINGFTKITITINSINYYLYYSNVAAQLNSFIYKFNF